MTKMIPERLSRNVTAAERSMFDIIRDASGTESDICFHSLGIARHHRKDYAETDFVLVTSGGVFCLEVKGGEVRREAGIWRIGWPDMNYISHEGPFRQAQSARWALRKYLEERLGYAFCRDLVVGWGVVFPNIRFDESDPEWDADIIYDQRDKACTFAAYVKRLGAYFHGRAETSGRVVPKFLSPSRSAAIAEALRGDFEVIQTLPGLVDEGRGELIALSVDQHRILDYVFDSNPRFLCEGAAGTGKTIVALEAARRAAASGASVLVLCFNTNLRRFLLSGISEDDGILVATMHGFFNDIIQEGGYGPALNAERNSGGDRLFREIYPQLFEAACLSLAEEERLRVYDVVIVDEAQDILELSMLDCLDLVIAGGLKNGRWAMFYDPGLQSSMYARMESEALLRLRSFGAATFKLQENFRNPRGIVSEACAVTGVAIPICRRSLVSNVDYRLCDDPRDQAKKLRALLLELMRENVSPGHVTILSPFATDESFILDVPSDIGKKFEPVGDSSPDAFTYSTVAGFKGLENDIIILTDLSNGCESDWQRAILYVGMTRARTKLFAFVGKDYLEARVAA